MITCCLPSERLGVVGRLLFGVLERELFGVVGLLEKDPECKRGNRCGDAVRFSISLTRTTEHHYEGMRKLS